MLGIIYCLQPTSYYQNLQIIKIFIYLFIYSFYNWKTKQNKTKQFLSCDNFSPCKYTRTATLVSYVLSCVRSLKNKMWKFMLWGINISIEQLQIVVYEFIFLIKPSKQCYFEADDAELVSVLYDWHFFLGCFKVFPSGSTAKRS